MATPLEASRVILGGGELNLTLPVVPDSKRKSTIISLFCGKGEGYTPPKFVYKHAHSQDRCEATL